MGSSVDLCNSNYRCAVQRAASQVLEQQQQHIRLAACLDVQFISTMKHRQSQTDRSPERQTERPSDTRFGTASQTQLTICPSLLPAFSHFCYLFSHVSF